MTAMTFTEVAPDRADTLMDDDRWALEPKYDGVRTLVEVDSEGVRLLNRGGKPEALMAYQTAICNHWTSFNYRDTCLEKTAAVLGLSPLSQFSLDHSLMPAWLGRDEVHLSHRSNLLRKLPDHYRQFWPDEPDDLPYVWPAA